MPEGALTVTMMGVPGNPPRSMAFQLQKRLDLMQLPTVELVMPGVATVVMVSRHAFHLLSVASLLDSSTPGPLSSVHHSGNIEKTDDAE